MEYIPIGGFVIGCVVMVVSWGYAARSMYMLFTNVIPEKKGVFFISNIFTLIIPGFYQPEVRKYIEKFWMSVLIFIVTFGVCMSLATVYFPEGIGS